jgi:aspartate aminotransferase
LKLVENRFEALMFISDQIKSDMGRGSWIRRMFEEGLELKKIHGAENVFDFTLGNPWVDPPQQFQDALEKVAAVTSRGIHTYMQNAGYPEVRAKIAGIVAAETGMPYTAADIVMTVGAAGASNVFLKSVLNPGDEVIVIAPFFPEYSFYISNHGGVRVVSRATECCLPDLDDLSSRLTDKTRVLMLNSPCNPTGRIIPAERLEKIAEMLREHSAKVGRPIYILSDEPYRNLLFDGMEYPAPATFYDNTVVVTSYSKSISLAGERIGYMAISPRCAGAAEIFAAATFCTRTLGFVNAPAIMQHVLLALGSYDSNVPIYQKKRDVLYEGLTKIGYCVPKPEGTFFMFPKSPIANDPEFVMMLKEELILVTPGTGFDAPGNFRISFAVDDRVITDAMPGFERAFKRATST